MRTKNLALAGAALTLLLPLMAHSTTGPAPLASGLQGAQGSTIGPDGALYVTEGAIGRITRIDR
jgi:hypothetical protein